jgi:hypothetical protein
MGIAPADPGETETFYRLRCQAVFQKRQRNIIPGVKHLDRVKMLQEIIRTDQMRPFEGMSQDCQPSLGMYLLKDPADVIVRVNRMPQKKTEDVPIPRRYLLARDDIEIRGQAPEFFHPRDRIVVRKGQAVQAVLTGQLDDPGGFQKTIERKPGMDMKINSHHMMSKKRKAIAALDVISEPGDGGRQAFVQPHLRLPLQSFPGPRDIGLSLPGIVLRKWFKYQSARAARHLFDHNGHFFQGHLPWIADIDRLVATALTQPVDTIDKV